MAPKSRTIVRGLLAAALVTGIGTATTAPAAAAPLASSVVGAAPRMKTVAVFPDPLTCNLVGLATGGQYECRFVWFLWALDVPVS
ncbi:hypothetical protein OMK64_03620 [Cellulomonas fimi]|uniref:hypothetical protein n=1 Tax=Cellulomonas fimi TaxID=1708 RepID=UPI00234DA2AD|nr:hypothetical protein [Cellulomonas fimi]MDC7120620.1 hypothetical protein [Cellulomonas fimi]